MSNLLSTITYDDWKTINWSFVRIKVKRLQRRIAKALTNRNYSLVKSLRKLLKRSFFVKLLAVRKVTTNSGKRTPGIDREIWNTGRKKLSAAKNLSFDNYKASPLRRIYIPKKNGKRRPLGIPTMRDRALQAAFALILNPIAECTADPNSYGFRPFRSAQDASLQCFNSLAKSYSPQWIIEADIKACFDTIDHNWLLEHIPMDVHILREWLKSGFMDQGSFHKTESGTPQGGIVSPILANMCLDSLEEIVKKSCKSRSKVNMIRYADDFIITACNKELLENNIIPTIETFLKNRGMELSKEKTKITHINDGFDFLGWNFRKYRSKLIIKPAKSAVKSVKVKISETLKNCKGGNFENMARQLNRIIIGWANYHRHICAGTIFSNLDSWLFHKVLRWLRRTTGKSYAWILEKHFNSVDGKKHFTSKRKRCNTVIVLRKFTDTIIERHIKIRAKANPFLDEWRGYFLHRYGNRYLNKI